LYHRVSTSNDRWSVDILSPQAFERQVEYLCRNYKMLSLDEIVQHVCEGKRLPKRVAAITIDDGYRDNFLHALPILRKHHVPATIFLVTGHIGSSELFWWDKVGYAVEYTRKQRLELAEFGSCELRSAHDRRNTTLRIVDALKDLPEQRKNLVMEDLLHVAGVSIPDALAKEVILSWEEVVEMSEEGIDFGAHTLTHPILTNVPLEQAKLEIVQSKKDIEAKIGRQVGFFSYPDGRLNAELAEAVRESGFAGAMTCDPVWIVPGTDRYRMGRMVISSEDFNMFKVMLSGIWGDYRALLRR